MRRLILVRHGQSVWNDENRFTGWTDVDLSANGIREAREAGQILLGKQFTFDIAFTSVLKRAIKTLWIILEEMDLMWIPVHRSWRLNERHYGALQGLNKVETAKKYGFEKVHIWRRGYKTKPPALSANEQLHMKKDARYANLLPSDIPSCESLYDTEQRVMPFWQDSVVRELSAGRCVLIAAHGSSLRALIKHLDEIPDEKIEDLNIPTGIPLIYELDERTNKPIKHYYLGDSAKIASAIKSVAEQLLPDASLKTKEKGHK